MVVGGKANNRWCGGKQQSQRWFSKINCYAGTFVIKCLGQSHLFLFYWAPKQWKRRPCSYLPNLEPTDPRCLFICLMMRKEKRIPAYTTCIHYKFQSKMLMFYSISYTYSESSESYIMLIIHWPAINCLLSGQSFALNKWTKEQTICYEVCLFCLKLL